MQSNRQETVQITLVLDEVEARWLMANLQNPLRGQNVRDEVAQDTEMRTRYFTALSTQLKDK